MNLEPQVQLDPTEIAKLCGDAEEITPERLIPILQDVQNKYGYLPEEVIKQVSDHTSIPLSRIFGVATFYEQFHLEPRGQNIIKCCRGTACHVKGATNLIDAIKNELGVDEGETTDDMKFTFETVACLGTCALAPVMMVNEVYHGKMTAKSIKKIIEEIKSSQETD